MEGTHVLLICHVAVLLSDRRKRSREEIMLLKELRIDDFLNGLMTDSSTNAQRVQSFKTF